jgi:tRNA(Glu) U13 pseudouridine synthase TruD
LRFSLRAGSFATVVLRELVTLAGAATEEEHA